MIIENAHMRNLYCPTVKPTIKCENVYLFDHASHASNEQLLLFVIVHSKSDSTIKSERSHYVKMQSMPPHVIIGK